MLVALVKGDYKAYYRKQGLYCFDFTTDKRYATDLTDLECNKIVQNSEFYKKMYGVPTMVLEENN